MKQIIDLLKRCHYAEHGNVSKYLLNLQYSKSDFNKVTWRFGMVLLLTRYLFLTGNTTGKEKMLKLPGSKAYYHILVKQMSAEQRDNDTFILLVISCSKLYTSITLNLNKCTQILYQLYIVGKGGHTPPPFLTFPPFLEIRDVPHLP